MGILRRTNWQDTVASIYLPQCARPEANATTSWTAAAAVFWARNSTPGQQKVYKMVSFLEHKHTNMSRIMPTSDVARRVFCTEGVDSNLTVSYKTPKNMLVNVAHMDEFSGELSRHTPDQCCMSPMCLLEVKKDPRVIDRTEANGHVIYFNAYIMLPGSKKKEKVQVQMSKVGMNRIFMPIKADDDYTVVVSAVEISHYATRVSGTYKIVLQMDNCTLYTFYKGRDKFAPQNINNLHTSIFLQKRICTMQLCQHAVNVNITLAHILVDWYSENFLVSMLFSALPDYMTNKYKAFRLLNGALLMVLHACVCLFAAVCMRLLICFVVVLNQAWCVCCCRPHHDIGTG